MLGKVLVASASGEAIDRASVASLHYFHPLKACESDLFGAGASPLDKGLVLLDVLLP
jgi:hypothetical protein